jgi:hypothetical protein
MNESDEEEEIALAAGVDLYRREKVDDLVSAFKEIVTHVASRRESPLIGPRNVHLVHKALLDAFDASMHHLVGQDRLARVMSESMDLVSGMDFGLNHSRSQHGA